MKIAFFWTWDFSKNILEKLLYDYRQEIDVVFAVSQPDKPFGRKQELKPTPIKVFCLENNIEVLQPQKLKDNEEFHQKLINHKLDFIVVVAYGKIIPQSILDIPKYGSINIHGSILPKYRWASPIQESLRNWDTTTGLTIMYMSAGMDEGDILAIQEVDIKPDDKTPDIFDAFSQIAPKLLVDTLKWILSWMIVWVSQDHDTATYCKKLEKQDGYIDFRKELVWEIYNKYRAYFPWPGIHTFYKGKKLDITECLYEEFSFEFDWDFSPWDVVELDWEKESFVWILWNAGVLIIKKVKLEWKKEMNIKDFINGNKDFLEYRF